jgi:hypothetical protein
VVNNFFGVPARASETRAEIPARRVATPHRLEMAMALSTIRTTEASLRDADVLCVIPVHGLKPMAAVECRYAT